MSKETAKKTPLVFYRSTSGKEPVREWLKALAHKRQKELKS